MPPPSKLPLLADLLAEAPELVLAQSALQERARVEAGRTVALDEDEVAAVLRGGRVPEVVEADLVERRRRLVAGDVPAELGGLLVGLQHRRHRVPADERAQAPLDRLVARVLRLLVDGDRVDVRRLPAERKARTRLRRRPARRSSRKRARSGPSCASTQSSDSNHSRVSNASMSVLATVPPPACVLQSHVTRAERKRSRAGAHRGSAQAPRVDGPEEERTVAHGEVALLRGDVLAVHRHVAEVAAEACAAARRARRRAVHERLDRARGEAAGLLEHRPPAGVLVGVIGRPSPPTARAAPGTRRRSRTGSSPRRRSSPSPARRRAGPR